MAKKAAKKLSKRRLSQASQDTQTSNKSRKLARAGKDDTSRNTVRRAQTQKEIQPIKQGNKSSAAKPPLPKSKAVKLGAVEYASPRNIRQPTKFHFSRSTEMVGSYIMSNGESRYQREIRPKRDQSQETWKPDMSITTRRLDGSETSTSWTNSEKRGRSHRRYPRPNKAMLARNELASKRTNPSEFVIVNTWLPKQTEDLESDYAVFESRNRRTSYQQKLTNPKLFQFEPSPKQEPMDHSRYNTNVEEKRKPLKNINKAGPVKLNKTQRLRRASVTKGIPENTTLRKGKPDLSKTKKIKKRKPVEENSSEKNQNTQSEDTGGQHQKLKPRAPLAIATKATIHTKRVDDQMAQVSNMTLESPSPVAVPEIFPRTASPRHLSPISVIHRPSSACSGGKSPYPTPKYLAPLNHIDFRNPYPSALTPPLDPYPTALRSPSPVQHESWPTNHIFPSTKQEIIAKNNALLMSDTRRFYTQNSDEDTTNTGILLTAQTEPTRRNKFMDLVSDIRDISPVQSRESTPETLRRDISPLPAIRPLHSSPHPHAVSVNSLSVGNQLSGLRPPIGSRMHGSPIPIMHQSNESDEYDSEISIVVPSLPYRTIIFQPPPELLPSVNKMDDIPEGVSIIDDEMSLVQGVNKLTTVDDNPIESGYSSQTSFTINGSDHSLSPRVHHYKSDRSSGHLDVPHLRMEPLKSENSRISARRETITSARVDSESSPYNDQKS